MKTLFGGLSATALAAFLGVANAQAPAPNGAAATPGATPPAAPAAAPAAPPGQPRPYKDVLKDAKAIPGYYTLHQKDEKVWIELKPEDFDKPFFFSMNVPRSIGERGLYGGQMIDKGWAGIPGNSQIAVWKKIGNHVQLIAKNTEFFAREGSPQAQFVSESFSDSLIASAGVAAAPHPETKAVVVEANALLFGDLPGYSTAIEQAFRMPFAIDARNTSFSRITNTGILTSLQVNAHFAVPKISPPPLTPPPVPNPPPPTTTPDARSFFVGFQYNFMPLPAQPMRPRVADERVGHFTVARVDYTDDVKPKLRTHYVTRWRLEKKDPAAAVSEPKEPIVWWLDKNVPEKYRKSVTEGILEWNKALETAGFRNAIVVKQQTEKDDFDTMDSRHASVRWFTGADAGFAIGPSNIDPRTGEILDADVGMSDVFARGARRLVSEDLAHPLEAATAGPLAGAAHAHGRNGFPACHFLRDSAREMAFAFDLLETRGLDMAGPEADAVAQAYVKEVIMHEVGHSLGLRHNFRASGAYTLKEIQDPGFTKVNGVSASVMDYPPFNISLVGEKQGEYTMSTIGPYDYWAIEYAYREIAAEKEEAELARIMARSTEPRLAFGTDEDAGYETLYLGIDPEANRFDLGTDPLAYYRKRLMLSRELWDRLQAMTLAPGESYERLTRSFANGFAQLARVAPLAAKYVGGVRHLRDRAGSGRPAYEPTPPAKQREALAMITTDLFQPTSFRFKPEFVSRIGIDQFERPRDPDVSISKAVLNVQKAVLGQLMADSVAARILDSQDKVADKARAVRLSEVYDTLQGAIWSELKSGQDIPLLRRNLQREHLMRISNALVKPAASTPADARALQRENALELQQQIRTALAKGGRSKEARAHLSESLNTLSEALKAPLQRAGV